MDVNNITVRRFSIGSFERGRYDGVKHVKELPYLSIAQATEGWYSFGLDGREQRDMKSGECFVAPALARQEITHHVDKVSGCMSARWVFMDVVINNNIPFDLAFSLPIYPERELCDAIGAVLDRMFRSEDIIDKKIGCYELLKLLMPYAVERAEREPRIDAAVYYIQRRFREPFSVEDVARACNMSEPNLYRLFKRHMGTSPIDYCNSLRVSHAFMMLEQSTYSIERIASMCGVDDPFYFSKMFKKKVGMSPAAYRKSLNK